MADLFAFYNRNKLPCRVCGKDFSADDKDIPRFHQRRIHKECFKCKSCYIDCNDPNVHPLEHHEYPYCQPCYCEVTGEPLCRGCHKLIEHDEKYVSPSKMPNKKFHANCFLCAQCNTPLKDAFSIKDGKPHCLSCHDPSQTFKNM